MKNAELSIITEMKSSLGEPSSRFEVVEETLNCKINKGYIIQRKEKENKEKWKDSEIRDSISHTSLHIMWLPGKRKETRGPHTQKKSKK